MTAKARYRLLALDIDGTIAGKGYRVPQRTVSAIQDAVDAGVIVSLITGRMRRSALRYAEECATNGPTVSYQGAIITAPDHRTDTHLETLDRPVVAHILEAMRAASAHINVYADDEIWVENKSQWALEYANRMQVDLRLVPSLDAVGSLKPTTVMAVDEPERIAKLVSELRLRIGDRATVTHSLPRFCEVASTRATKSAALETICRDYGIAQEQTIAIGDGEGDMSMVEWADLGVASGDAHPELTTVADLHIAGPDECGVADFIHDLLEQGKLGR